MHARTAQHLTTTQQHSDYTVCASKAIRYAIMCTVTQNETTPLILSPQPETGARLVDVLTDQDILSDVTYEAAVQ